MKDIVVVHSLPDTRSLTESLDCTWEEWEDLEDLSYVNNPIPLAKTRKDCYVSSVSRILKNVKRLVRVIFMKELE